MKLNKQTNKKTALKKVYSRGSNAAVFEAFQTFRQEHNENPTHGEAFRCGKYEETFRKTHLCSKAACLPVVRCKEVHELKLTEVKKAGFTFSCSFSFCPSEVTSDTLQYWTVSSDLCLCSALFRIRFFV